MDIIAKPEREGQVLCGFDLTLVQSRHSSHRRRFRAPRCSHAPGPFACCALVVDTAQDGAKMGINPAKGKSP
jgi:hypothetical protein